MYAKQIGALALISLASVPAFAHSIFLNCTNADTQIECKSSFSDGSSAENIPFEVISYDDELLKKGRTDPASSFSFLKPDQEYYILLDAGPGHVIELDMLDVE